MIFRVDSDLFFLFTAIMLFINLIGYGILNLLNDRSRYIADQKVSTLFTSSYLFSLRSIISSLVNFQQSLAHSLNASGNLFLPVILC